MLRRVRYVPPSVVSPVLRGFPSVPGPGRVGRVLGDVGDGEDVGRDPSHPTQSPQGGGKS